jgi:hypothetical protein
LRDVRVFNPVQLGEVIASVIAKRTEMNRQKETRFQENSASSAIPEIVL